MLPYTVPSNSLTLYGAFHSECLDTSLNALYPVDISKEVWAEDYFGTWNNIRAVSPLEKPALGRYYGYPVNGTDKFEICHWRIGKPPNVG